MDGIGATSYMHGLFYLGFILLLTLKWPRGLNDLGSVLVNWELIFDTTKFGLAKKIKNFPFHCGQIGPTHLYLLTEIPKLIEELSIKNIATSKRGQGEAPGKFWKSMNVRTFLTPLFGVWNFFNPPFLEVKNFFDPPFLAHQNFFDPPTKFSSPPTKVFMNIPLGLGYTIYPTNIKVLS